MTAINTSATVQSCNGVEPIYATREQAWVFVAGGSRKTFETHVRPHVPEHRIGGRVFYKYEELRKWANSIEAGVSPNQTGARGSTSSASRTNGDAATSQRARQIAQQLKSKPRESTPRLYPVGDSKTGEARG